MDNHQTLDRIIAQSSPGIIANTSSPMDWEKRTFHDLAMVAKDHEERIGQLETAFIEHLPQAEDPTLQTIGGPQLGPGADRVRRGPGRPPKSPQ